MSGTAFIAVVRMETLGVGRSRTKVRVMETELMRNALTIFICHCCMDVNE